MASINLKNTIQRIMMGVEVLFELCFALITASILCLWQNHSCNGYHFLHFLIYYLSIWVIQKEVFHHDFGIFFLVASMFYDYYHGYFFAGFTIGFLVYTVIVRDMIYAFLNDKIHEIYLLVMYSSMLYLMQWALIYAADLGQSLLKSWYVSGLIP